MTVRRRVLITLLGGAAIAWPLAARAQQPAVPVIGYLHPGTPEGEANRVADFRKGLAEAGYVEGRNVAIVFRWGRNDNSVLAELAADLVRRRVAVIATPGSSVTALATKAATATIPIVFSIGDDPVEAGLVAALNRPGGNVTGFTSMSVEVIAKRLGLLHELVPEAARFAALVNPTNPSAEATVQELRAAASILGRELEAFAASTPRDIDAAFKAFAQKRVEALLVAPGVPFAERRVQIATLAAYHRLPAAYSDRQYAEAGGLMSYGPDTQDMFRQAGIYTGRVLKGEKPADLPVQAPTKYEMVINLKTANALGLEIPPPVIARADEIIE
jgi:putative ABC transport system substrate-binding protein